MDKSIKTKLKKIKALVLDVDGVIFTGRVFIHPETGEALKERSYIDGQGISLLREIGIKIAFVTAEKTGFSQIICDKLNSLPSVESGRWSKIDLFLGQQGEGKAKVIEKWLEKNKIKWEECAAMGDDIVDYHLLKKVGFAAAPAQAEIIIKKIVHYIAPRKGGDGAIRDLCCLILEARGINPLLLTLK